MPILTPKQERLAARERFLRSRRAEIAFRAPLLDLSNKVGSLIGKFVIGGDIKDLRGLLKALHAYARQIRPWARIVAKNMQAEVSQRDAHAWFAAARTMGYSLREEIANAPLGKAMHTILDDQVDLITSLPLKAAQRVHELALRATIAGTRSGAVAKEILRTSSVTAARARLIAHTEVGRTASTMTEVRARSIGSKGYIWHTARDPQVRPAIGSPHFAELNTLAKGSHRKLEGTYHAWDDPPIAGTNGERAHPGCIFSCRCWAEPILPDRI